MSPTPFAALLQARSASPDAAWAALWLTPAHGFAMVEGALVAASLDLARLDALLARVDLAPLLPGTLGRAVRKRQIGFVGGRLCAERCLGELGVAAGLLPRGAQGEPQWPAGWCGSISHTDAQAHAVAGPALRWRGIGIDAEHIGRSVDEIAEMCCTAFERRTWLGDARTRPLAATLLFSAKESFYKAVHPTVGRYVDFDEAEVAGWDSARSRLTLRATGGGDLAALAGAAVIGYRLQAGAAAGLLTAATIAAAAA